MRCRVQNVTSLPNGTTSTKDREVTHLRQPGPHRPRHRQRHRAEGPRGRVPPRRYRGARLRHRGRIGRPAASCCFDDVPAGRGALTPETVVGIGPYQIRLLPPERGFDLALSIESGESAAAAAPPVAAAPLRIRGGLLARRPLSWLLFAARTGGLPGPAGAGAPRLPARRGARTSPTGARAASRSRPCSPATTMPGTRASCPTRTSSCEQRCEACHVAAVHADPQRGLRRLPRHRAPSLRAIRAARSRRPCGPAGSSRCAASSCHSEHRGAARRHPAPAGAVRRLPRRICCGSRPTPSSATSPTSAAIHPAVQAHGRGRRRRGQGRAAGAGRRRRRPRRARASLQPSVPSRRPEAHAAAPTQGKPAGAAPAPDGLIAARVLPGRRRRPVAPDTGRAASAVDVDGVLAADFTAGRQPLLAKLSCASCHLPDAGGANMRPVTWSSTAPTATRCSSTRTSRTASCRTASRRRCVDVLTYFYGAEAVAAAPLRTDDDQAAPATRGQAGARAAPAPTPQAAGRPQPNAAFAQAAGARVRRRRRHRPAATATGPRQRQTDKAGRLRHPAGPGAAASGSRWRASTTRRTPTCPARTATPPTHRRTARTCCCRRSPTAATATWARRPPRPCRRPAPCATSTTRSGHLPDGAGRRAPSRPPAAPPARPPRPRRQLPRRNDGAGLTRRRGIVTVDMKIA